MKVQEIITEVGKGTVTTAFDALLGMFTASAAKKALLKQAAEALAKKYGDDLLKHTASGSKTPFVFADARVELKAMGYADDVIDALVKNPKALNAIKKDAEAASRAAQWSGVSGIIGKNYNSLLSFVTAMGIVAPVFNCITGIMEDTKKGYDPKTLDDQVYYRIERMIGEIAASLGSRVAVGYLFKLPVGFQSWFGWFPGFTKVTDAIAKLGPTAQAGLQAYLMTPDGRKMLAEWFAGAAFGASQARWVREMGARYLKDWTDPFIAKLQDFTDPTGAPDRQAQRDKDAATQLDYNPLDPAKYQGTNKYKYDAYGKPIN
jgi:hypothetical protein